jgi:hypothetical protein
MISYRLLWAVVIVPFAILAPGCSLSLSGAPCPCISSMSCCESTMTCMEDMAACPPATPDQSASPSVSGACLIRAEWSPLPLASDPDVGRGYVRQFIPGVNDLPGLTQACTRSIYQKLLDQYCATQVYYAESKIITYNLDGTYGPFDGGSVGFPLICGTAL